MANNGTLKRGMVAGKGKAPTQPPEPARQPKVSEPPAKPTQEQG